MKRSFCIIFVLLMVFCLTACPNGDRNQSQNDGNYNQSQSEENMTVYFKIGDQTLSATLQDNSATSELVKRLISPITLELHDYGGWEKVGDLGFELTSSDRRITAQPCDFVLYQGNQFVLFYGSNTWSYTPLGRITGVAPEQLKEILGSGTVEITISL